jgi:hypothetical protein
MPMHFLDSCALQHRYLDSPYSRRVRGLVSRKASECFISEWSVLEMSSAFANRLRRNNLTIVEFDLLNNQFLKDIAEDRLKVINMTSRDYIKARNLIRYTGVVKKRNLKSGDAMVATCCLALALERKEKVSFYTSDWTLYDVLRKLSAFSTRLNLVLLGVPKAG